MLLKDLQKLGFTKNVSVVFLCLFEMGQARAGEIIRKTGLHRNLVYTALDVLEGKKLITKHTERGVAQYSTLDPMRIMEEVDQKKKLAEQIIEVLKTKQHVVSQEVVIYEGKDATINKLFETFSTLTKGDTWYILGLSLKVFDVCGERNIKKFIDLQRERGFFLKGIGGYLDKRESEFVAETNGLTEFKYVPSISKKDIEVSIVRDRIMINIFTEPYTVIEIFNKDLVQSYREYFNYLWNQDVRLYKGWNDVNVLFNTYLPSILTKESHEYVIGAGYGEESVKKKVNALFFEHNGFLIKNKIHKHILMYEKHRTYFEKQIKELGDKNFTYIHVKYLPDTYSYSLEIHVFGDLAIVSYFGKEPVSTVYEQQEIVDGFKKHFDLLWSFAKA